MINRNWDLNQQHLQVNGHVLLHLHGLRQAVRKGSKQHSTFKYMSPPENEQPTLCSPAVVGRLAAFKTRAIH